MRAIVVVVTALATPALAQRGLSVVVSLEIFVRTSPGNRLTREEEFDLRPIDSERALWDLYLYRATRARDDKDLPPAASLLKRCSQ